MDLEHLPLEILINIIARLPMGALRQLMLVSHRFRPIIQRVFSQNSEMTLRGADRLLAFRGDIMNNPESPFRMFGHLRFEDYNAPRQGEMISNILLEMPALQTVYFNRSNVSRALPALLREEAARRGLPMARLLRITVAPFPRQVEEQMRYLELLNVHQLSLQYLRIPPLHGELYRLPPLWHNLSRFLAAFLDLRTLILEFSVPLALDSILVNSPRLESLQLVYIARDEVFNFTVLGVDRVRLPGINTTLRQLNITMNLLSAILMQFIGQHLRQLAHLTLIGDIPNRRAASDILSRALPVPNITHLEIQNQSRVGQLLPGVMDAFLHVTHLTISRRGLHIDAPTLNLHGLNLTVLNLDRLAIPRAQVALIVQTVTRRGIYVREAGNNLRFVAVNRLPVAVFTVRIFVNGLQHLRIFDSTNRNYQQFFNIDQ